MGIWNLLAVTCVFGHQPKPEVQTPNPNTFEDSLGQESVLLIRIAQARWIETESTALAERLVALSQSRKGLLDDLVALIDKHDLAGRRVELLLDGVYSRLPCTDWEIRRKLLHTMQDRQRRRLSDAEALTGGLLPSGQR